MRRITLVVAAALTLVAGLSAAVNVRAVADMGTRVM